MSYNEIPIVTQDITVGTSKVKYLNLSHNSIDEIRPGNINIDSYGIWFNVNIFSGVLENLKSLQILDLSFNNLETIKNVGSFPTNLSVLSMSNNKLTKLSKEIINFVPKLKVFNVEKNLFNSLTAELAKIVNKGPTILFGGKNNGYTCTIL